jgi:Sec-independent protein translocase protein TatA
MLKNRTYFFNVKENRLGDLYLNIVESKHREDGGGFERQSVIFFADDLPDIMQGLDESLRAMDKAVRGGKRPPPERERRQDTRSAGEPWERRQDSRPAGEQRERRQDSRPTGEPWKRRPDSRPTGEPWERRQDSRPTGEQRERRPYGAKSGGSRPSGTKPSGTAPQGRVKRVLTRKPDKGL